MKIDILNDSTLRRWRYFETVLKRGKSSQSWAESKTWGGHIGISCTPDHYSFCILTNHCLVFSFTENYTKHLSTTSPNLRFIEIDWLHAGEFNIRSFMDNLLKLERAKFIFRGRNYPTLLDFDASSVRRFKEFRWESYIYNPIYTIAQEAAEAPKPRKK